MKKPKNTPTFIYGVTISVWVIAGAMITVASLALAIWLFFPFTPMVQIEKIRANRAVETSNVNMPAFRKGEDTALNNDLTRHNREEEPGNIVGDTGLSKSELKKLFAEIQKKFYYEKNLESHFYDVRKYLYDNYPEKQAEALYQLYREYLSTLLDIQRKYREAGPATSYEEVCDQLDWIDNYVHERLGSYAEPLLGKKLAKARYEVEWNYILNNPDLTAEEKRKKLADLDWWAENDKGITPKKLQGAYPRYQYDLALHEKELSEMDPETRAEVLREIRSKYYSSEAVRDLERLDKNDELLNKGMQRYNQLSDTLIKDKKGEEKYTVEIIHKQQELIDEIFPPGELRNNARGIVKETIFLSILKDPDLTEDQKEALQHRLNEEFKLRGD